MPKAKRTTKAITKKKPVTPNPPLELSQYTTQNVKDMSIEERNYLIGYLYILRGLKQVDIAPLFGMSDSNVSLIISALKQDDEINSKLMPAWEKDISIECARKATALIDQVDPEDHPKSKLVVDGAILIDKTRELRGKPDVTIAVLTTDLRSIDQEISDVNRQLGVYE